MTKPQLVDHYGSPDRFEEICARLVASGFDLDRLDASALAGVDEFHLGGRLATEAVIDGLTLGSQHRVLDVGCGIGGAARSITLRYGCDVVGVDLTPEFIHTATALTDLVGLADRARFEVGDALSLGFALGEFDAVTMFHVGMNIADKAALFVELARVLRPGGTLVVYDIMGFGRGDVRFPVPWAGDATMSHLAEPDDYAAAMRTAGLDPQPPIDRTELVQQAITGLAAQPPPVDLSDLMGADWPVMFANLRAALQSGLVRPIQIVGTRN